MKPRILILMHYMELGGAESALLGLLQAHNPQKADLDLFIYAHRGELMNYIPRDKVNVLPEVPIYSMLESPVNQVLKKGFRKLAMARLIARQETAHYSKYNTSHLDNLSAFTFQQAKTVQLLPAINPNVEYDLAISFLTPHYIVLDKVRAKKKLGWIHTDYSNVFVNKEMEYLMWSRLDYIASISDEVANKFCGVFPLLKNIIVPIENILSTSFIRKRAEEFAPVEIKSKKNEIHLLSIGRYSHPKRFDEIGTICRMVIDQLNNQGLTCAVKWFIIGYGSQTEENKMLENIARERVKDCVIVLGKRTNPYPYIKACDIYVQPSRYEGKSITVREAQILCKPVLVSNYPTASSQIVDGVDGMIAPMDTDAFAKELASFILNKSVQNAIIEHLHSHDYGNENEIEKIYKLASK